MALNISSLQGSIRTRLLVGTIALALIPLIILALVIGTLSSQQSTAALQDRAYDQIKSISAGKEQEIRAYLGGLGDTLTALAASEQTKNAIKEFPAAFNQLPSQMSVSLDQAIADVNKYNTEQFSANYAKRNPGKKVDLKISTNTLPPETIAAQYLYIANNANPLGEKNKLMRASDASQYTALHAKMQPFAKVLVEKYGLYDIFLVEPTNGFVVYTYFKELDFGTSLTKGPWANSGLAKAYTASRADPTNTVHFTDFAPYVPSYDDQAGFMSVNIVENGQLLGVLIIQVPIDRINAIMTFSGKWKEVGLGASGETYLVGSDLKPRSISRFVKEDIKGYSKLMKSLGTTDAEIAAINVRNSNLGIQKFETQGVRAALGGASGAATYPDYRKVPVLGAYAPFKIYGLNWALISEIDESEALASANTLRRNILLFSLAALALMGLIATFVALRLSRSINTPLEKISDTVVRLNAGELDARTGMKSGDELNVLGKQLDDLLDDRVATFQKAEKENEELNNSVITIMGALATLSQKDLTAKVPVSADVTGAVSDGLNYVTSETAKVLKRVEAVSMQVAQASVNVRNTSESARTQAAESSQEIESASAELATAADALTDIADQARNMDIAAGEAIKATREALAGVRETVTGIGASRDLIRETEKRIKRLGERTQEISTAVNSISSIADRTGILALNTSMQAVAAGEAGRAYAVVADEVKRLAESARTATQQIANLVGAIQSETVDTVDAINRAIGQVVEISKTAERAGEQMQQTETKTGQLVESVRQIARTTEEQSRVSGVLQQRAVQLQAGSANTTLQLDAQSVETKKLVDYAQGLVESVSVFRLPD
jgi:methyl-accepting chemotaxis protein